YALFHIAAWRRLVVDGMNPTEAVHRAVTLTSPVVLTAGLTTAIGASSLWFAETGFIRAFGPALIVAVSVALLVGLLLVPSLFAIAGPWLAWPRSTASLRERGRWVCSIRWVTGLLRFRWVAVLVVVATVAGLAAAGSQARSSPLGFNIISGLPD